MQVALMFGASILGIVGLWYVIEAVNQAVARRTRRHDNRILQQAHDGAIARGIPNGLSAALTPKQYQTLANELGLSDKEGS